MVDKRPRIFARVVIALFLLLVLRTALLRPLFVPLVDHGEVEVFLAAGALGDDADAVEVCGVGFGAVELFVGGGG